MLESRVLAAIPSSDWLSTGFALVTESGADLLSVEGNEFATGSSSASAAFSPAAGFGGSPSAVPEPSTLLLAALGGIGLALAIRRRTSHHSELSE